MSNDFRALEADSFYSRAPGVERFVAHILSTELKV